MSALQKLRAYFGMVPADELDEYDDERYADGAGGYAEDEELDSWADRAPGHSGTRNRPLATARPVSADYEPADDRPRGRRHWQAEPPARRSSPVHGALAMEPEADSVPYVRATEIGAPQHKITTLHLRSYLEARTIGEHYRDGHPVIMNMTEMEDADAKRLVDFAAGLVFALRGSMDKITSRVFLISPPNMDVSAEQRRRLAEGGLPG
ncbi:MAG TPA: cell division protein SepF [Pseudonocardiaceae bacterium]